jgi:hypothetical protein
MMTEIARLLKNPLIKDVQSAVEEEELYTMDVEEAGYQSAFARLHSISKSQVDYAADVGPDLNLYARKQLEPFISAHPAMHGTLQSLDADLQQHMKSAVGLTF